MNRPILENFVRYVEMQVAVVRTVKVEVTHRRGYPATLTDPGEPCETLCVEAFDVDTGEDVELTHEDCMVAIALAYRDEAKAIEKKMNRGPKPF